MSTGTLFQLWHDRSNVENTVACAALAGWLVGRKRHFACLIYDCFYYLVKLQRSI